MFLSLGALTLACAQTTTTPDGSADARIEAPDGSREPSAEDVASDDAPDNRPADATPAETQAPDHAADQPASDHPPADTDGDAAGDLPSEGDDGAVDSPASGPCDNLPCVTGSNWAQWPMPNNAADVANGAPHPANLIDNGDDTVTDGVTGLMWQRSATVSQYMRSEAQAHCHRLRTGGHDDWRMPSAIELSSIVDFDHFTSSIDATVFPDSPIEQRPPLDPAADFVTTSVAGAPTPSGWLVDFAFGLVSLDTTAHDRSAFVRCVRGAPAAANDTSAGRYDLSEAGVARDVKTGLVWQRGVAPSQKWSNAKAFCAAGTGLPGQGWRLPTMKELLTLVDFARPDKPGVDESVFGAPVGIGDPYGVTWSATAVVGKPPYSQFKNGAWTLYLHFGANYFLDADLNVALVRCVR